MDGAAAKLGAAPGAAKPFGCTEVDKPKAAKAKAAPTCCVNFALCAPGSRSAWLALAFPEEHPGLAALGAGAGQEIFLQLDGTTNRSGDTWHVEIRPSFPAKGAKYAWLLDPALGPDGFPSAAAKRIVDPCAKELDSSNAQHWNVRGTRRYSPWAVVPDPRAMQKFDWQGVQSPGLAMKDLVIYEAHVRGFTANPDSGLAEGNAGTFLGFVEKIPHLLKLGINCVEFLPVFEFDETACPRKNPSNGEQLCNYWGYSTVAFFVPMQRFSNRDQTSGAIVGFKTLVRELHRQGIEVILDVVFNHTAEGTWGEHNWHSMSAVSKPRYYLLSHGKDTNYTGCGNTMNANDGLCADWICECLRYWVRDMHVDGFRFDLASSLCRGGDGQVQREPHLIKKMLNDPVLSRTKLIAEPWDCSWPDGYLVGKFPSCGTTRWAEWNGVWRDTVRRFIKGDPCMKSEFATRMCGSSDLYRHDGRSPFHSINFITAHDGFTLYDLVSYNEKHNLCNGENSGDDHNNSWNCGHEGNTGDGNIKALRDRQMRNFLAALFLSIGTPMMVFGDEYGRTQHGCNNGWCQDSLSWFSWDGCSGQESRLLRFCRLLIAFRKRHARVFCRDGFLSEKDIWWRTYWDDEYSYLCWVLHDNHDGKYDGILIAFNAGHETRRCDLPPGKEWYRIVDTNLPSPKDICEDEKSATKIGSGDYSMAPRSCIVLKCFADKAGAYDAKLEQDYLDQQRLEDHLETIAQRRMSMEFDMQRTMSRVSFSRLVSDEEAEETWQRTMSQSLMKRQSMMSGFILEMEGPDGEKEFAVQRPDGHQVPVIGPDGLVANGQAAVKKKAEAEAAAKRKAEAEAAAQLKAVEELAAKRKADEELAAKRKADEEAAAKKKEPVVLETPEAVRNLLSGKRALHVKGFGGGLGDVPEEQRSEQRRQDEAAAQAIERFCPDFLVVDGDPWGSGFQRYIKAYADRQVRAGLAVPTLIWVKNIKGSSPTPEEREKRIKQAREWADQGLPVVVSWLPDAKISEGVDRLFGAGCWKKLQEQKFDFRGAVRLLEAAGSNKPEWLRRLADTAPGREMHSAIEAVEGRPDKKWFEKFSLENAAKGNAIYQHLRGGGHEPAAQGAVSFGGGESVLLEFATLYLSPCSGFDADQAALFPFRRGRPDDPVLPAHEGRAFTSAQVCFKVTCNATNPGEGVFIVGSSPQLGDWDPAKGVACATTTETFPVWTSEPVSMHTAAEFKIVVQHAERRDGARWEGGGNKSVEGAALAGADSLTLSCSWGGLEVTATRA